MLVGINCLGTLHSVGGLVAILDADKEGFLRSEIQVQTIGRAARNAEGRVIMKERETDSMRKQCETNGEDRFRTSIISNMESHQQAYKRMRLNTYLRGLSRIFRTWRRTWNHVKTGTE